MFANGWKPTFNVYLKSLRLQTDIPEFYFFVKIWLDFRLCFGLFSDIFVIINEITSIKILHWILWFYNFNQSLVAINVNTIRYWEKCTMNASSNKSIRFYSETFIRISRSSKKNQSPVCLYHKYFKLTRNICKLCLSCQILILTRNT